jgi:Ca2+-binding EF-hand superfamily protein
MTKEQSTDIANKWMKIADTDGGGTIDLDEFQTFIKKIDEELTEEAIK